MASIGVTGARGRLGAELVRRGCLAIDADVTDHGALEAALLATSPDVVVHCAAMTSVDGCQFDPLQAARVNTGGTWSLGRLFAGKIVYISTDYVFDGRAGPYDELARPSPISVYGWSKLGGELALQARGAPLDLVVRTTILYGAHSDNFVTSVLGALQRGERVALPEIYGSPTYIPHLADGILAAIKLGCSGVLNIAGRQVVSRLRFGKEIARIFDLDPGLVVQGVASGSAPRPKRAGLKIGYAEQRGVKVTNLSVGLEAMAYAMETVGAG